MAPDKKRARRAGAWLIFLDESGFLLAPLVRRSWALRGRGTVLEQRTRQYRHVSALAALCVSPDRDEVRLYFRLYAHRSIRTPEVLAFLGELRRVLPGPRLVLWDRLGAHRSRAVQALARTDPGLMLEYFPPYAPELNPVEYLWSYLKLNPLANRAPADVDNLHRLARNGARSVQRRSGLLRSFVAHSPLPLRLRPKGFAYA